MPSGRRDEGVSPAMIAGPPLEAASAAPRGVAVTSPANGTSVSCVATITGPLTSDLSQLAGTA